jgi:predicted HD phosphohydrolase
VKRILATTDDIFRLYATAGGTGRRSEGIRQLEHGLQCAYLAWRDAASDELVVAAFLHDIGHIVIERPLSVGPEIDDFHQFVALPFLRGLFGAAVLEPIRLHVDAKRYLCRLDSGYGERLSAASQRSLALQGGPMSGGEASAFLRRRFAQEAIRLRLWDDQAKVPGCRTLEVDQIARALDSAASCHKTAIARA